MTWAGSPGSAATMAKTGTDVSRSVRPASAARRARYRPSPPAATAYSPAVESRECLGHPPRDLIRFVGHVVAPALGGGAPRVVLGRHRVAGRRLADHRLPVEDAVVTVPQRRRQRRERREIG